MESKYVQTWISELNKEVGKTIALPYYNHIDGFNIGEIVESEFDDNVYMVYGYYFNLTTKSIEVVLGGLEEKTFLSLKPKYLKLADETAKLVFNIFASIDGCTQKRNHLLIN